MLWGISETMSARACQTFAIMFNTCENLLVEISGAIGTKKPLCKQICFEKMLTGISEVVNARAFNQGVIVFSQSRFICQVVLCSGMQVISPVVLGMKESHFLSKNVFWENADRYLRNSEC